MIYILITIAIILLLCLLEVYREKKVFKVTYYHLSTDKVKKNMRIVLLADLHGKSYGKDNEKLLDSVINLKPDYILSAGDMIIHRELKSIVDMERFYKKLADTFYKDKDKNNPRIFYSYGNHELRAHRYDNCKQQLLNSYKELEKHGVILLKDQSYVILDDNIDIYGLDIPREYYAHFKPIDFDESILKNVPIKDESRYNILISHHPSSYLLSNHHFDLTLSGHLHGGMIRLPFIGGLVTANFKLGGRHAKGIYTKDNKTLVITGGLGDHLKSIRFNNTAEIVVIDINQ